MYCEYWNWLYREYDVLDMREAATKKVVENMAAIEPKYPYDAPALGVDSHTRMTRAREFETEEL